MRIFLTIIIFILLESAPVQAKEYKVKFNCNQESLIAQRDIINKLSQKEKKEIEDNINSGLFLSLKKWEVCIDQFDLNNDGEKEIFAYFPMAPYCGNAGCMTKIFTKENNWKEIYSAITYNDFIIKNNYSGSFRTIISHAKISCGDNNCFHKDKNGKKYFDNTILKTLRFNPEKQVYTP